MENRKVILDNIKAARESLLNALELLVHENEDGKQFDYVNAPRLSDSFDALNRTVKRMNAIIYQEN